MRCTTVSPPLWARHLSPSSPARRSASGRVRATGCARPRRCPWTSAWISLRWTRSSSRRTLSAVTFSRSACCTLADAEKRGSWVPTPCARCFRDCCPRLASSATLAGPSCAPAGTARSATCHAEALSSPSRCRASSRLPSGCVTDEAERPSSWVRSHRAPATPRSPCTRRGKSTISWPRTRSGWG